MAQKCEMKLLGVIGSVFVSRVMLVLKLKSIEYEFIEEDLCNKSELLLTSNPLFQKVPVLFHANEQPIFESLPIMEYLDEIQPNVHPLFPSNPSDRVQHRILAYTFDTLCVPPMREFMLTQDKERREEVKTLVIEGMTILEEELVKLSKGKAFYGGDDIGFVDIVVGSFLGWFKFHGTFSGFNMIDEVRNPKLAQWAKSMWSHEVVRSVIPNQDVHIKFYYMVQDMLKLPRVYLPISA